MREHHVLFVVNTYPPRLGGLENHVASLSRQLAADGHRASVFTLATPPSPHAREQGVSVRRLRGHLSIGSVISFPAPGTARKIARAMGDAGVTAVSTHTRFFPMSFVGRSVARRLGVPLVHTEHGSAHVRGVSRAIALASRIVDLTMGRMVLRGADVVLAVSEQVAAFVRQLAGVDSVIFYNAIDAPPPQAAATDTVRRFVFVGRIVPGKGWDDLLEAARLLRDEMPSAAFELELLGDGPLRPQLSEMIDRLGLSDIAVARGQVSPEVVHRTLAGSTLVNPTTLAEGFQTTLLEALAAGSQLVSYPAPGVEELRADGAPVRIAATRTVPELADLMGESLAAPMAPFPAEKLARWTWPERTKQYLGILSQLRER